MNKGTSQKLRISKALQEDYISLDERSLLDLVQFTLDYSQHIKFFGLQNKEIGFWNSFLQKDVVFVLSRIAKSDFAGLKYESSHLTTNTEKEKGSKIYVQKIGEINDLINQWSYRLKQAEYNGILLAEIEQLQAFSNGLKISAENKNLLFDWLKETYDSLFGTIVFIREKASENFEKEVMGSQNHTPHIGLLLSFFKLFQNVQNDINTITKKHLDFYYLKVLQQKKRKPEQGTAIVELELLQGTEELNVNEGEICEFSLEGNQKINFATSSEAQINKAKITDIITLYKSNDYPFGNEIEKDKFSLNILYEEEIIRDGKNLVNFDLLEIDEFPATLGEAQIHDSVSEPHKRLSDIGIVVSSPALFLEKGSQKIVLTFKIDSFSFGKLEKKLKGLVNQEIKEELKKYSSVLNQNFAHDEIIKNRVEANFFRNAFLLSITNDEGWKDIRYFNVYYNQPENKLIFHLELDEQSEHLRAMDNAVHEGGFKSDWPCIKIRLNNATQYHPYKILKNLVVEYVLIETHVENAGNLNLSNSSGTLDNSIPFLPFGPLPVTGSYLQIHNPLIFQKNLTQLKMFVNWSGLPQDLNGFKDYYAAYPNQTDNNSFKAILTQNKNTATDPAKHGQKEFPLFTADGNTLKNETQIPVTLSNFVFRFQIDPGRLNPEAAANPVFMVLTNPQMAFGHQSFTNIYATAALNNGRFKRKQKPLPNQPYTPVIERMWVNYSNSAKEVMQRKQDGNGSDVKIIHLYPFGHIQTFPGPVKSQSYLLPQIKNRGHLFIGLSDVKPGNIVNIGFVLVPAVYINTAIKPPEIKWEYLLNNEWESLGELFLEDSTFDLIKSGIIKIRIPDSVQVENTYLPSGKFWIRGVSKGKETLNSRIKKVFTQAVSVISNQTETENQNSTQANPKTEKINFQGLKGIGKISGPYAFEMNKLFENEESFYSRISEQLRHKNRAVSNWDVERIILDKYKDIDKVRVYGRSNHARELIKGSTMQIVLIPKNKMGENIWKRNNKVDYFTLNAVKDYVSQWISPYTKIEVSNPVYEQLKVKCRVKFMEYQKRGTFLDKLNRELISYLSPDIDTPDIEKGFDESYSKTEILNFIESRPYVDFVTEFSVLQLIEVQGRYKIIDTAIDRSIQELHTISPYAILTSAPMHQIEIIQDEISLPAEKSSFGDLSIEYDFVISRKEDYN